MRRFIARLRRRCQIRPTLTKQGNSLLDSTASAEQRLGLDQPSNMYRLDMLLARTEWKYDRDACANRLSDSYLYITDIADAAVRTACLAQLYSTLQLIDPQRELEGELKLHSSVSTDLNAGLTTLLSRTARQFQATEAVIRSLARTDIQLAASIADKLNIRARKDKDCKLLSSRDAS